MTDKQLSSLMILDGAIWDIHEKTYDAIAKKQLYEVMVRLEEIIVTQYNSKFAFNDYHLKINSCTKTTEKEQSQDIFKW